MPNRKEFGYNDVILRAITEIHRWGSRRVLIDKDGTTTSPERAFRLQDMRKPDVIFIRSDGWTLGAIKELADIAESLWKKEWVAVLVIPGLRPITYEEYKALKNEQTPG